ncbi:MAG: NGG1p interacting factor NIF3 [Spirochaetota bacterium]
MPQVGEPLLERVKEALFQAGAGQLGLYQNCSWQTEGVGQFLPLEGSQPAIGRAQQLTLLAEYKLELLCPESRLRQVLGALHQAHPYENPAYEMYPVYGSAGSARKQ